MIEKIKICKKIKMFNGKYEKYDQYKIGSRHFRVYNLLYNLADQPPKFYIRPSCKSTICSILHEQPKPIPYQFTKHLYRLHWKEARLGYVSNK